MKKIILFILVFLVVFSFSKNQSITLYEEPSVNEIFKYEEISKLDMIVKFFDNIIIGDTKEKIDNQAYQDYFEKISNSESLKDLSECIKQTKHDSLKTLIINLEDKGILNEIWEYSHENAYPNKDTLLLRLSLNLQGKYFQLLEIIGDNNDFIYQYCNYIKSSGYISPLPVAYVMKDYNNYIDFNKDVYRLIWAVHYITILYEEPYIK